MATLALHSPRTASLDALRSRDASLVTQIAGIVGFAVLTGLFAQFEIKIYLWEVPITLQTLAVYSSGLYLGSRNGLLAMLLYLALGLFLPFYAGGASGAAHLVGVTGGYLVGYPLAAMVIGAVSQRWNTFPGSVLATLAGSFVLFACGVTWLHTALGDVTWWAALDMGWLRFIVWDLTKIVFVGAVYGTLRHLTA